MVRQIRAARVAQTVRMSVDTLTVNRVTEIAPPWLEVVEQIPPAEVLTRTVPMLPRVSTRPLRKPKNTYRPRQIVYEEDELRATFFRDHPWELARPRIMVETDGQDARRTNWGTGLRQPGIPVTGESVVQRQMWLMNNTGLTKEKAYDIARKELYALRHKEDVARRIAQEEARMVGAYFGKSALQVGMTLEDGQYEAWKRYAKRRTDIFEAKKAKEVAAMNVTGEPDEAKADVQ